MKRLMAMAAVACLMAASAFALDLDMAKAQGLVGEQRDGYLGAVKAGGEVDALIADINAKRRAEYARIAAGNGQPVATVEKLAASKAFQMTKPGHYIMDAGGAWVKK